MILKNLVLICLIIFAHLFIIIFFKFKQSDKEKFIDLRTSTTARVFNCGECFYKKTKDQCEKSFTGKYCDTPCKWSKTIKYNSDNIPVTKEFCEENKPFYHIIKF